MLGSILIRQRRQRENREEMRAATRIPSRIPSRTPEVPESPLPEPPVVVPESDPPVEPQPSSQIVLEQLPPPLPLDTDSNTEPKVPPVIQAPSPVPTKVPLVPAIHKPLPIHHVPDITDPGNTPIDIGPSTQEQPIPEEQQPTVITSDSPQVVNESNPQLPNNEIANDSNPQPPLGTSNLPNTTTSSEIAPKNHDADIPDISDNTAYSANDTDSAADGRKIVNAKIATTIIIPVFAIVLILIVGTLMFKKRKRKPIMIKPVRIQKANTETPNQRYSWFQAHEADSAEELTFTQRPIPALGRSWVQPQFTQHTRKINSWIETYGAVEPNRNSFESNLTTDIE